MKRLSWRLSAVIWSVAFLALSGVSVATALPSAQDQPTPTPDTSQATLTPTFTPGYFGPTFTPTPTLMPPPPGGGRVAVAELVVRYGPSIDYDALGGLKWNDEVFPFARSENGTWVVIEWPGDQIGWISALLVVWDPALDLDALPVLLPPATFTPRPPTATLQPTEPSQTPAVSTPSPQPSATFAPSTTPLPLPATAVPVTSPPTEVAAVVPTQASQPDLPEQPAVVIPSIDPRVGGYIGGGLLILIVVVYGWQQVVAHQELKRYARGFPLETCPVCQEGRLDLDEVIRNLLGVPRVQRSVRCSVCRSVLRELQPGRWRYTIDPYVNPALAEKFHAAAFADSELQDFARQALNYPPQTITSDPQADPEQTAQALISKLEAKFLKERAKLEAEERARAEAEAKAKAEAEKAAQQAESGEESAEDQSSSSSPDEENAG